MEKKQCSKCLSYKELSEFHKDKYRKDGFTSWCKLCRNIHHANYRFENQNEKDILYKRKKRLDPNYRKKEYEYYKRYIKTNKDWKKEYDLKYFNENKEKIYARRFKWRLMNLEKVRLYDRIMGQKRKFRNKLKLIIK